jgi:tetratricopeptide (TPR) repeat protein
MISKIIISLILFISVFLPHSQLFALEIYSAKLEGLYQAVLNDPTNHDVLYEYAQTAIQEGDFEAAVGALEGMLVNANNQPRLFLEIGLLYQRIGSSQTALYYLLRAKELSNANSEIANIADEYLAEIEDQNSPHYLKGMFRLGFRYQDNPTLAPKTNEIFSGGSLIQLPSARKQDGDINGFLFSSFDHHYNFSSQTSLVSEFILYGTAYSDENQFNTGLLQVTSGPMFKSEINASGQSAIRPHIILYGSILDSHLLENTAGLGVEFQYASGNSSLFKIQYQFQVRNFEDYNNQDGASLNNGNEHLASIKYRTEFKRGHIFAIDLSGSSKGAERQWLEIDQYDIILRYSLKFRNFLSFGLPKMTLTPHVMYLHRDFGGAGPDIDPDTTRTDHERRLGLSYYAPFTKSSALVLDIAYSQVDSNIINYDTKNNLFTLSYQKEF